jgi:ParB-like chromosome segregation protein Spo0J
MPISYSSQAAVESLQPHPANPHTHSQKQIAQIARSIQQFGFTSPIIVDENNVILAGHGRRLAAKQLGLEVVPIAVVRGLSELQKRAYLLADNKLVENAGWDRERLSIELKALIPDLTKAGLDIELTGFKPVEIRSLTSRLDDSEADADDEPPLFQGGQVTRRVICGAWAGIACFAEMLRTRPMWLGSWATKAPPW